MQDSPFDQGHRTNPQLNFRQPFSDFTPYMLFSPFLSGLFCQIRPRGIQSMEIDDRKTNRSIDINR